ncbi:MAG: DUF488 domain-containing protein [Planctomycetes bacterium]|nr:DUF488 domain-containing protein [Planctomycetota bacterium]
MRVYTLGYTGWQPAELLEVAERLNATVIDVRLMPRSRWSPGFNAKALQAALGDRYVWLEGFGNLNYKGGPIVLKDFAGAVAKLGEMSPHGPRVILMCGCADVNVCHRKMVAERLAKFWHCPIEHLERPKREVPDSDQLGLF